MLTSLFEFQVWAHKTMHLIRRFEEEASGLYREGNIGGFCHLCIGQEAIAAGCYGAKQPQDSVITAYRDHGHILAAGTDPKTVMAELTGRSGGCSKGKGGSMHMFDIPRKFYGGHGIVGAQVPIGTGLAFSNKALSNNGVCLTFMGDGAANQGQVYEAMNMASLWNLPVLYIIENNFYGMGTSTARAAAGDGLYKRGEGFGISGKQINGMNAQTVFEEVLRALEEIRKTQRPQLIEMMTYRFRGHSMSDPARYRSREEVDGWREQDPLLTTRAWLLDNGVSEDALNAAEASAEQTVQDAVAFALSSPEPALSELWTHVTAA